MDEGLATMASCVSWGCFWHVPHALPFWGGYSWPSHLFVFLGHRLCCQTPNLSVVLGTSQSPHPALCLGVVICIIGTIPAAMSRAMTRVRCEGVVLALHSVTPVEGWVESKVLPMFLTTVQVLAHQLPMAPGNTPHQAHSRC